MNKCKKCGAEFEGKFCPECGTEFPEPVTKSEPVETIEESEPAELIESEEAAVLSKETSGIAPLPVTEGATNDFSFRLGKKTISHETTVRLHKILSLLGPLLAGLGVLFMVFSAAFLPLETVKESPAFRTPAIGNYLFYFEYPGWPLRYRSIGLASNWFHILVIAFAALALLFRLVPMFKTLGIPLGKKHKLFVSDCLTAVAVLFIPVAMGCGLKVAGLGLQKNPNGYSGFQFYTACMLLLFFACLIFCAAAILLHWKFSELFSDENKRNAVLPKDSDFPAPESKPRYDPVQTKLSERVRKFSNTKLRILVFAAVSMLCVIIAYSLVIQSVHGNRNYGAYAYLLVLFQGGERRTGGEALYYLLPLLIGIIACAFWCISLKKRKPKPEASLHTGALVAVSIASFLYVVSFIAFLASRFQSEPERALTYIGVDFLIFLIITVAPFIVYGVLAAVYAVKAKKLVRELYGTTAPSHIFSFAENVQADFEGYARYRTEVAAWNRAKQKAGDENELISSSLSKSKPLRWTLAGIMFGYYALMLILGLVGYLTHAFDGMMGAVFKAEGEIAHAYSQMIFFTLLTLLPTILLYLAVKAPFYLPKLWKKVLFAAGIILPVLLYTVYMSTGTAAGSRTEIGAKGFLNVLINADNHGSFISAANMITSSFLPLIGTACFTVIYTIDWRAQRKTILPKGKFKRLKKFSEGRFMSTAEKFDIWYFIATLLCTYFLYPLVWVIVLIVVVIVFTVYVVFTLLAALGSDGSSSSGSYSSSDDEIVVRDGYGREVCLRETSNRECLTRNGIKDWYTCYRSGSGDTWYSKDGKEFFKK